MDSEPAARMAEEGRLLVDAVGRHLAPWVADRLRERFPAIDDDTVSGVTEQVVSTAMTALTDLVASEPQQQTTTPLAIVRASMTPATRALHDGGIEPIRRDPVQRRIDPDDPFGLGPANWAELGDDVAEAGLRWGAAKAFEHLRRRAE